MNCIRLFALPSIACLFTLFMCGCGTDSPLCTANVVDGLVVSVYDAQTHAPLAARATVTIRDGSYTETLVPRPYEDPAMVTSVSGAVERAGIYTVDVTLNGYTPYEMKNVRVTKNACHVNGVGLEVDLQPVK